MKKLKQIWRYYFNPEIKVLRKLKIVLEDEYNQKFLNGMCGLLYTYNLKTNKYYFNSKERKLLEVILYSNAPKKHKYR